MSPNVRAFLCSAVAFWTLLLSACKQPIVPLTWTAAQEQVIRTAISQVSEAEITSVLEDLNGVRDVHESTPEELAAFEDAIVDRLASYGLATGKVPVVLREDTMNNLIGTRGGLDPTLAPVLVTAHWDSMPNTTGMDDNASGCAGVVEVARVLQGVDLQRTVVFATFAFEEMGLVGSTAYAAALSQKPKAVINLEMIGYTSAGQDALPLTDFLLDFPTLGDFIGVVSADFSKTLGLSFCTVAAEYVPDLPTYMIGADQNLQGDPFLRDLLRSDHTPFWEQGIQAIMVTDTSFLREGSAYHTPEDTLESLDIGFMAKVIQAVAAITALEAGMP